MANNLNRVTLIGRLTRDAETRVIPSGSSVTTFDLAVNRRWKDKSGNYQEDTLFIRVEYWLRQYDNFQEILIKGKEVFVEGYLRTRSWQGQDGQKRSSTEVVAQTLIPLERSNRDMGGQAPSTDFGPPPSDENSEDVPF
jgi:single-strand DNA-binding protein